jgi:copper chaperone
VGTNTRSWKIEGMHCASCSILIDEVVEELAGVHSSSTSRKGNRATVTFDPSVCPPERIVTAIEDAGYSARPVEPADELAKRSWFSRRA